MEAVVVAAPSPSPPPIAVATTVECTADGVTQKVYVTRDCSGEPMASIPAAFGEWDRHAR